MADGFDLIQCQRSRQILGIDDDVIVAERMAFRESNLHGRKVIIWRHRVKTDLVQNVGVRWE